MGGITIDQIIEFVKSFGGFLTAGGVIAAFAVKYGKKILRKILKEELKPFEDRMDQMEKDRNKQHQETNNVIAEMQIELKKNSLNTMKNTICNENIPLSERIEVGKEYIEKGGNGAVKIYYHKLEEEYERKLQKEEKL